MIPDGQKGVIIQRDKTTYAVVPHISCGLTDAATLRKLADVAEKYQLTIKVTGEQRIALIGLREEQVDQVWSELDIPSGLAIGNGVRGVKACPGTDFCKRGQQNSLKIGQELDRRYYGMVLPGKIKFGVSGCAFQCCDTQFKDIGLFGKPKGWTVIIGGSGGSKARIGQTLAEGLSDDDALALVDRLMKFFQANASNSDRMGRLIERLGIDAIQKAVGIETSSALAAD